MTHPTASPQYPVNTPVQGKSRYLPTVGLAPQSASLAPNTLGAGSLADYLGFKKPSDDSVAAGYVVNALPFLAYHRIWDDWYRDSRIQAPLFYRPDETSPQVSLCNNVRYRPFTAGGVDASDVIRTNESTSNFSDGVNIATLRQRNWSKDYFTAASTLPQAGNAATLEFDVTDDSGNFSIAALRSANSLQKWLERNNIAGYKYSDQIYAQYGIYPSDAIMDKCIYLGRTSQNVYTRSVFQTGTVSQSSTAEPVVNNVFKTVGSKYGSSQAVGEGSLVDNIRVTEHGFLMVLASLVPHAYYSTGVRRYLNRKVVGDIAFPLLSGMGDQAILTSELHANSFGDSDVFGYTDLYAEYKYHDDEVHGLLRDGESLQSFALQRTFTTAPVLSSSFLEIPTDFMKQVFAISSDASGFDCWYDIYFPYKKVSTLPEYSLPTLADLKNTHTKFISRGGKRL